MKKYRIKKGAHISPSTEFIKGGTPWNKGKINVQKAWNKGLKTGIKTTGAWCKGSIPWNKGKEFLKGNLNPNWQGGKSFEQYGVHWTELLKESIRQRDNYKCKICGLPQNKLAGRHKKLDVHHRDSVKTNCNPINLITLCRRCHTKIGRSHKII